MDAPTSQERVQSLYNSPYLSDVTVSVYNPETELYQNIFAHKVVLATRSSALNEYFQLPPTDDDGTGAELDFDVIGTGRWYDCAIPVIRYLYGLPLCDEDEYIKAEYLGKLSHAADDFGIPGLREHALSKLEERLVRLLTGLRVDEKATPSCRTHDLITFACELERLLTREEKDSDSEDTEAMKVAVKVCCTHFAVVQQSNGFNKLFSEYPKLLKRMLFYAASHGDELLSTSFGSGEQAITE